MAWQSRIPFAAVFAIDHINPVIASAGEFRLSNAARLDERFVTGHKHPFRYRSPENPQ
ncbi:MAG TPA: hypothetical protein VF523_05485 [Burkholderiales bacterium]